MLQSRQNLYSSSRICRVQHVKIYWACSHSRGLQWIRTRENLMISSSTESRVPLWFNLEKFCETCCKISKYSSGIPEIWFINTVHAGSPKQHETLKTTWGLLLDISEKIKSLSMKTKMWKKRWRYAYWILLNTLTDA